jgi:hypothetical protein
MKPAKPVLWMAVGIILGITVTVAARPNSRPPADRLANSGIVGLVAGKQAIFEKDTRTGACWLAVGGGGEDQTMALAVAPKEACD